MNRRWVSVVVSALVLLVVAGIFASFAYSLGVSQGLAQNPALVAPGGAGPVPAPYYYGRPFGPWGFGPAGVAFGLVRCLIGLAMLALFFGVLRTFVWRGHWGYRRAFGPGGPFDEWHRRAHAGEHDAGPGDATSQPQP